jgi:protein-disulfide isomerase
MIPMREIMRFVLNVARPMRLILLLALAAAMGSHAQTGGPATASAIGKLSPDLARRVEIMIRSRADLSPEYLVAIGDRTKSDVPGFDEIDVVITAGGKSSKPIAFLLSQDGKTLAQFNKFDISQDPKEKIVPVDRPGRGGPANAPVLIVGFDDLECPFCAQMNAELFPAVLERYKDQVRVVYLDFPITEIHPWAMRAAIDANCLGVTSTAGYWNYIDYIHAHAAEMGGAEKTVVKANEMLDRIALDEGARQKLGPEDLAACIKKQDDTRIRATMKQGDALGVAATPALFINGEKLEGIHPIEYVYRMIDGALTAAGQTPPPPVAVPTEVPPAAKPGN